MSFFWKWKSNRCLTRLRFIYGKTVPSWYEEETILIERILWSHSYRMCPCSTQLERSFCSSVRSVFPGGRASSVIGKLLHHMMYHYYLKVVGCSLVSPLEDIFLYSSPWVCNIWMLEQYWIGPEIIRQIVLDNGIAKRTMI